MALGQLFYFAGIFYEVTVVVEYDQVYLRLLFPVYKIKNWVLLLLALDNTGVLCLAERQKKLTALEVAEFKEFLNALPIKIDSDTSQKAMGSIYMLAKTENLTVYDAAYLEIAIRENCPLATFDKALKQAAKRQGVLLVV